ncbi:hypothetical protein PQQ88_01350 [Paraburkholderia caledonica]|uniref:hypothetical protein n=1 Tax=Paraburkholderia caledonica TaxID=134536 RepID=UPI0038B928BB
MKKIIGALIALYSAFAVSATTVPVQLLNPTGSTSGQAIVSTGASSAPTWGSVAATALASQAANTVVANATVAAASPTAFAMPSCSASGGALQWTSGTGFTCVSNAFASPPATGYGSATPQPVAATTITATSTITPSQTAGIVGTTTNNNANAGSVGEFMSATASSVNIPNNSATNITSVTITPGDWDCNGTVSINGSIANLSNMAGGVSSNSAALGSLGTYFQETPGASANGITSTTPTVRYSLSGSTTIYLIGYAGFGSGTVSANGLIRCRRLR